MIQRYEVPEPYDEGMLDVGDGNQVYWQVRGAPQGKPAVIVHGGPGGGFYRGGYRSFDPARYRLVLFDQRGCGASTPHAGDPATDMRHNTTGHLIADMERLREHLGIERWLLYGYSWGCVLSLAYAEQHPDRVSEIILAAVFGGRRRDIEWLYRGAGRFYPGEWERFAAGAGVPRDGDIVGAYARLMEDPDPAVRQKAALDWCAWEDAVLSHETQGKAAMSGLPSLEQLAFVRTCAHYFSHGAFLEDGVLIREAGRLAGIPGVMVHGRMDMCAPLENAWELSRAWPDAELLVAEDAGHLDSETKIQHIREAVNRFADRLPRAGSLSLAGGRRGTRPDRSPEGPGRAGAGLCRAGLRTPGDIGRRDLASAGGAGVRRRMGSADAQPGHTWLVRVEVHHRVPARGATQDGCAGTGYPVLPPAERRGARADTGRTERGHQETAAGPGAGAPRARRAHQGVVSGTGQAGNGALPPRTRHLVPLS